MQPNSSNAPLITNVPAPDFSLPDHHREPFNLGAMMGTGGVVLGFIGDIWRPVSVHRILGLQRSAAKLAQMGWPVAMVVRDRVSALASFHLSSPLPVPFPLLADSEGMVHNAYKLDRAAGLLLIDRSRVLRYKWQMSDDAIWPAMNDVILAVQGLLNLAEHTGAA